MIFIFTDVKVGFCYSFDGVNQQKFSRTPKNFHAHDFEKIFTVIFCISRALFKIFSRAFHIFTGRNLKIFTEVNLIFTGKKNNTGVSPPSPTNHTHWSRGLCVKLFQNVCVCVYVCVYTCVWVRGRVQTLSTSLCLWFCL